MDSTLQPGVTGELTLEVTADLCTQRGDQHIFSTPNMIGLVERACIHVLQPYLEGGQHSVGVRVNHRHLGPTLAGMKVTARARVREVDRRRIIFDVTVFDELGDQVGETEHDRFIIDVDKYMTRLADKRARLEASKQG